MAEDDDWMGRAEHEPLCIRKAKFWYTTRIECSM